MTNGVLASSIKQESISSTIAKQCSLCTNLLDEYINYTLLVIICIFFYSALYIVARFVLEIIFYILNKQKFSKGDLVMVTTKPWKGCVGKITKVGIFTNNIKITKSLNRYQKIPKKTIKKTVNEIKQT